MASHSRKLQYRALLENLSTLEDETSNNVERMEKTATAIMEVKALLANGGIEERVEHPGEVYLDSRVLRATGDLVVQCSEGVSSNANAYDRHELAAHIRENPGVWEVVLPREAPATAHVFGTFAGAPPERRARDPRRAHQRRHAAALQAPDSVDRLDKVEEGSEMVSRAHRLIKRAYRERERECAPLSLFHVVLDPHSFSRTIENLYYVSYLVRDSMIKLQLDGGIGLPTITPTSPQQDEGGEIAEENQFVVSLDMGDWRRLIDIFDIREPFMVLKKTD